MGGLSASEALLWLRCGYDTQQQFVSNHLALESVNEDKMYAGISVAQTLTIRLLLASCCRIALFS